MLMALKRVGSRARPSGVGWCGAKGVGIRGSVPRGWVPGSSHRGGGWIHRDVPDGVGPRVRLGMGLEDRGAGLAPRLLECSRLVGSRDGSVWPSGVGRRGRRRGVVDGRHLQGVDSKRVGLRVVGIRWVSSWGEGVRAPRGGPYVMVLQGGC